jgi:hypothetical protein
MDRSALIELISNGRRAIVSGRAENGCHCGDGMSDALSCGALAGKICGGGSSARERGRLPPFKRTSGGTTTARRV